MNAHAAALDTGIVCSSARDAIGAVSRAPEEQWLSRHSVVDNQSEMGFHHPQPAPVTEAELGAAAGSRNGAGYLLRRRIARAVASEAMSGWMSGHGPRVGSLALEALEITTLPGGARRLPARIPACT